MSFARQFVNTAQIARPVPLAGRVQRSVGLAHLQARGYAADAAQADNRAKLVFRIKLREIPMELWPLGVVVGACVVGGTVALIRILVNDPDLMRHRSVGSGALDNNSKIPEKK
ncbi:hypothetical protein DACRYDRAFT_116386 [Dacryopinax primogenitus]|uniref:Uncharacterized protein n=1 Tax=Dacryopinax primogenitus (strain DJM 731) TaxID=1858805 RepID=M5FVW7_DACPD|nr:uncharacterized protein DACRYDRAFT_116386 [Dacryopinax primogenitus]EJU01991.1 hypothetical protein DACRYDRAFT_116386 [Dacryopinax primogenitus]